MTTENTTTQAPTATITEGELYSRFLETRITEMYGPRGAVYRLSPAEPAREFLHGFEHQQLDDLGESLLELVNPAISDTPLNDLRWALAEVEGFAANLRIFIDALTIYAAQHLVEDTDRYRVPASQPEAA